MLLNQPPPPKKKKTPTKPIHIKMNTWISNLVSSTHFWTNVHWASQKIGRSLGKSKDWSFIG